MSLPISREEALKLVRKYNSDEKDIIHYLESEAVCRGAAERLGEDKEYFGMLGLLHDIDWGMTKDNIKEHLTKAPDILREKGFDDEFIRILISHGYGFDCAGLIDKKRTDKKEFILAASETITGIIHAYALMRNKRISDMEVNGLKKKFKDKKFAEGCDREIVREIENVMPIDEFFEIAIASIKKIKNNVGLE